MTRLGSIQRQPPPTIAAELPTARASDRLTLAARDALEVRAGIGRDRIGVRRDGLEAIDRTQRDQHGSAANMQTAARDQHVAEVLLELGLVENARMASPADFALHNLMEFLLTRGGQLDADIVSTLLKLCVELARPLEERGGVAVGRGSGRAQPRAVDLLAELTQTLEHTLARVEADLARVEGRMDALSSTYAASGEAMRTEVLDLQRSANLAASQVEPPSDTLGPVQEGPLPTLDAVGPDGAHPVEEVTPLIANSNTPAGDYMTAHPEVFTAWKYNQQGASWEQYAQVHFELVGKAEGFEWRGGLEIDPAAPPFTVPALRYFEQNSDVLAAYRANNQGLSAEAFARRHFADHGAGEGRVWPVTRSVDEARNLPPDGILEQAERWTGHRMEKSDRIFAPVADVVTAANRFMDHHPELDAEYERLAERFPGLERSEYAMYYLFTFQSDANKAEWGPTEEAARTAAGWASYFTILDHSSERRTLAADWERLRGVP